MSNYIMHNGQLYTTDELMHWKYIKRERVNGKWRYYYDYKDMLGYDEKARYDQAGSNYINTAKKYVDAKQALNNKNDGEVRLKKNAAGHFMPADVVSGRFRIAAADFAAAGKKYVQAEEDYMKTPLYKINKLQDKINKGRRKVSNWLDSLRSKKKK